MSYKGLINKNGVDMQNIFRFAIHLINSNGVFVKP